MKARAPARRDRLRAMLADLMMPGALEAVDGVLSEADGGTISAVARFEACSTFTRVAAHMVAKPPRAARCTGALQSKSLPPSTAPIATGWSDSCRAGFAPAG